MNRVAIFMLAAIGTAVLSGPRAVAQTIDPLDVIEVVEKAVSNTDEEATARAAMANEAAAGDAVVSITAATQLDLDIHLLGRTSVSFANVRYGRTPFSRRR